MDAISTLNNIYQSLKSKDTTLAETYKEGVFDHIERILTKQNIIRKVGDEPNEFENIPDYNDEKDLELVKTAIKNLVDFLA